MKNLSHTIILCAAISTASNAFAKIELGAGALDVLNIGALPLAMWYVANEKAKIQQEETVAQEQPSTVKISVVTGTGFESPDANEVLENEDDAATETSEEISTETTNPSELLMNLYPWVIQP